MMQFYKKSEESGRKQDEHVQMNIWQHSSTSVDTFVSSHMQKKKHTR